MKNIYKQPELNKMAYAVSEMISASGDEPAVALFAYDNETTLNYPSAE